MPYPAVIKPQFTQQQDQQQLLVQLADWLWLLVQGPYKQSQLQGLVFSWQVSALLLLKVIL